MSRLQDITDRHITYEWSARLRPDEVQHLDRHRHLEIAPYYPGTEPNYLDRIVASHARSQSSISKIFCVARHNSEVISYAVVTVKSGDRAKIGPIWTNINFRRRGIASNLLKLTSIYLTNYQLYMTVPEHNHETAELCLRSQFMNVSRIPGLYDPRQAECIYIQDGRSSIAVSSTLDLRATGRYSHIEDWLRILTTQNYSIGLVKKRGGANKIEYTSPFGKELSEPCLSSDINSRFTYFEVANPPSSTFSIKDYDIAVYPLAGKFLVSLTR